MSKLTFPPSKIGAAEHTEILYERAIDRDMHEVEGTGCPCGNPPFSPWDESPLCWQCLQEER